jgi:UDP-N-acetylglucosamine 2-epimerase (non-hydrolysing)
MACAITSKKLCIEVVHVEAGIRSGDITMPEEINRILTDSICDHFFTTSESASLNLKRTGIRENCIHFVGNTMIDTLYENLANLRQPELWQEYHLHEKGYYLITLHRPANVDNSQNLRHILDVILNEIDDLPLVFPVHPRTKKQLPEKNLPGSNLILAEPMGYLEFIYLVKNAKAVITDSGGITEETTVLNIPCLTLRNSTERPETIAIGSNVLVGTDPCNLIQYLESLRINKWKKASIPPLWDGKSSVRILNKLLELYYSPNRPAINLASHSNALFQ